LAPADGTVVMKSVFRGQYVKEGERLFETADLAVMWVQLVAYESDIPWLRTGQRVVLRADSAPEQVVEGRIDFVDPNVDPATRGTRVRVVVPNPVRATAEGMRRLLRHRITATAEIDVGFEAFSVPRSAVLRGGGPAVVYVDHGGGSFERREVQVGRIGDQRLEVLGGLEEGERVVVEGALMIDAQAQLNYGTRDAAAATEAPHVHSAGTVTTPPALLGFLRLSSRISTALAASDPAEFAKEVGHLGHLRSEALDSLGLDSDALRKALESVPLPPATEALSKVEEARRWFVGFGRASGWVVTEARTLGMEVPFRIYQCPMVATAFPGAPKRAVWVQEGEEVRNPYFGATMPDCGTEIREVR
jgi:Cu(I)/Ag(I) efflux system membrane fusion protein